MRILLLTTLLFISSISLAFAEPFGGSAIGMCRLWGFTNANRAVPEYGVVEQGEVVYKLNSLGNVLGLVEVGEPKFEKIRCDGAREFVIKDGNFEVTNIRQINEIKLDDGSMVTGSADGLCRALGMQGAALNTAVRVPSRAGERYVSVTFEGVLSDNPVVETTNGGTQLLRSVACRTGVMKVIFDAIEYTDVDKISMNNSNRHTELKSNGNVLVSITSNPSQGSEI